MKIAEIHCSECDNDILVLLENNSRCLFHTLVCPLCGYDKCKANWIKSNGID